MAITIDNQLCVGCGCCMDVCKEGALELDDKAIVNEEYCTECKSCIEMCPVDAISCNS